MQLTHFLLGLLAAVVVVAPVDSLILGDTNNNKNGVVSSRRAFGSRLVAFLPVVAIVCTTPDTALAYDRRDVGGEGRSAATAAFNIQAYETQNRLEREGFKLETQEEQKASLTAALADYSYSPSSTSSSSSSSSSSTRNKSKAPSSGTASSKK